MSLLKLPPGCSAKSSLISLPSHLPQNTRITISIPDINISSLENIWQPIQEVINFTKFANDQHKLPPLVLPHTSIHSLKSTLQTEADSKSNTPWYLSATIAFSSLLLIATSLFVGYFVFFKNRTCTLSSSPQRPKTQPCMCHPWSMRTTLQFLTFAHRHPLMEFQLPSKCKQYTITIMKIEYIVIITIV